MRLRKSNQGKRFDSLLSFGLSDGEEQTSTQQERDSSDEEFVVDPQQQRVDQEEHDIDLQEPSDFESPDEKQSERRRKKKNRRSWAPNDAKPLGEVQPYPTESSQKWTRTYVGPIKRWTRLVVLLDYWFSDREDRREVFYYFMNMWWKYELLPPKLPQGSAQLQRAQNGWMPDNFILDLEDKFRRWYQRHLSIRTMSQHSTLIDRARAFRWFIPQAEGDMTVLLGHVSNQKEYRISQCESIPFSDSGVPIEDGDDHNIQNGGWVLDVGGIVLSMGWAPIKGPVDQLLAMAVTPYSDQAFYKNLDDAPKTSELKEGTIQIWKFEAEKGEKEVIRPARSSPKLVHALCFHWGRVGRMQWCPVPLTSEGHVALLAALCGDGKLRVIEVTRTPKSDSKGTFEELQQPMATIEPPREYTLEINCFTWINMNRVAVGLSDGSVALWSLSPCQQLHRHPIHSSPIMDIVSGYPSSPFLVATMPMGGVFTLTDLNRPTAEKTYHGNPVVSLQPNVVAWSDHLRGFASIWPTSFPGTSTISFVHSRVFPLSRHICTIEGQTMCLAFGTCHPFLLIGGLDGSVWILNVLRKVSSHRDKTHKLKLFQHEYCPLPPSNAANNNEERVLHRGACRILHGFLPQHNIHPLGMRVAKESRVKRSRGEKKAEKKRARKSEEEGIPDEQEEVDDDNFTMVPGPITIHEPLTRITAVSWNPNAEFSWWAAAAMGSGLVRVMDLGVEDTGEISGLRDEQAAPAEPEDNDVGEPEDNDVGEPDDGNQSLPSEEELGEESDDDIDMTTYE
ncbi:WD40 repeat-like protein [Hypoxylon sp. FL0543]|nr:WD40 repeat-like protein [Hypoxylon sp. FL0543]